MKILLFLPQFFLGERIQFDDVRICFFSWVGSTPIWLKSFGDVSGQTGGSNLHRCLGPIFLPQMVSFVRGNRTPYF